MTARRYLTPTLLSRAAHCPHSWFLECHGDPTLKAQPDAGLELIWAQGLAHEREMIARLPACTEPQWDGHDWAAGMQATVELMQQGAPWIYQAVLFRDDLYGKPDLLERIEAPSALGGHSYRPLDIKNHNTVRLKDRLQLAAYAHLLEPLLGARPAEGMIWLSTGEREAVKLEQDRSEFERALAEMRSLRDGAQPSVGYRCGECKICDWHLVCRQTWEEEGSVCLVAGVTSSIARKLRQHGITSFRQLAAREPAEIVELTRTKAKTAASIVVHARAWEAGRPIRHREAVPDGRPVVHYDIETLGGVVYLHGLILGDGESREERTFLARRPEGERAVWHELLAFLAARPEAVVYHWAEFERTQTARLWREHGGDPVGWARLQAGMRDLKKAVQGALAAPVTTYSIKEVAPVFGFRWQAADASGLNSEAWYERWLETGDEAVLQKIVQYNLDDVRAMEAIYRAVFSS